MKNKSCYRKVTLLGFLKFTRQTKSQPSLPFVKRNSTFLHCEKSDNTL